MSEQSIPLARTVALPAARRRPYGRGHERHYPHPRHDALGNRASGRRHCRHILTTIKADNPVAYDAARARCGPRCQDRTSLASDLFEAADSGAIGIARHLIASGVRMSSDQWYEARRDLRTCEGSYLPSRLWLSVAVARGNDAMVNLLLPVSDSRSREEALLNTAELDRMAMVLRLQCHSGVRHRSCMPRMNSNKPRCHRDHHSQCP